MAALTSVVNALLGVETVRYAERELRLWLSREW